MRDLISPGELDHLRAQYPDKIIKKPTAYQQQVVMMYFRGLSPMSIAKAMGKDSPTYIAQYLKSDSCQALLDHLRTNEFTDIRASREYLTSLMYQSYHRSATATEEIMALREIGKLNGLYESDKQAKNVNITQINNIQNVRQLEKMTEAELVELSNHPAAPVVIDQPEHDTGEPCEEAL